VSVHGERIIPARALDGQRRRRRRQEATVAPSGGETSPETFLPMRGLDASAGAPAPHLGDVEEVD
jgi:hypothetical protein